MLSRKIPNPIDKHVGAKIRLRRMMLKMSQGVLGNGLGLTFQQVQKYEKGTNRVGASRLQNIARVLKVPVEFFFEDSPGKHVVDDGSLDYIYEFLATKDGINLVNAFVQIKSTKVRKSVVNLVAQISAGA